MAALNLEEGLDLLAEDDFAEEMQEAGNGDGNKEEDEFEGLLNFDLQNQEGPTRNHDPTKMAEEIKEIMEMEVEANRLDKTLENAERSRRTPFFVKRATLSIRFKTRLHLRLKGRLNDVMDDNNTRVIEELRRETCTEVRRLKEETRNKLRSYLQNLEKEDAKLVIFKRKVGEIQDTLRRNLRERPTFGSPRFEREV